MSTHIGNCVWCGKEVACCEDEFIMSSGQETMCDAPNNLAIEFCSLAHFYALQASMSIRMGVMIKDKESIFYK